TNTNINILAFPVETYKWFVLGVSGGITNSSTNTNTLIITNFGNITLTSPPDNDIHNIAIDGNNISFSWSYSPLGSLHIANVYLLDSSDNPVRSNMNVSSTSSSINISTLPYGDYKWYVMASNTNSALVVYSTTNNIKITNYASVGLTSPSDNYTNNIVENGTTISFSWAYSPTAAFNQANVYVLDSMNNVVASGTGLTTTSWSTSIPNVGVYNWYVLATNTSTGMYSYSSTNTIYVTNFGSISLVSYPTNNHRHNILSDGNSISLSWSYTPAGAFNQATVYILNAVNNTVAMSTNVNTTNPSIDLSSLPSGRYRWFVMATNTTHGISAYTPTNNISVYRISNIYSGVFFSEISWAGYRISSTSVIGDGEFIELYNTNSYDINLNGWTLSYLNNTYGANRNYKITNDLIIRANSILLLLNATSNTNYLNMNNIEDYYFYTNVGNVIANGGFVFWLWSVSGGVTNVSDHVIATTSGTNTFTPAGANTPPLFSTNGSFAPIGSSSAPSNISMVRTNFIYAPTNATLWRQATNATNLINGAENFTLATPGLLY
ncbi:MAG: lamin tail domain-containing protein, partial [Spirochaetes bacterium]|nr:lamin tail domain-containing protein [Spirochaetota bacterium]